MKSRYGWIIMAAVCLIVCVGPAGSALCLNTAEENQDEPAVTDQKVSITLQDLIVWVCVGALAGSVLGILVTRKWSGFGAFNNIFVGLVGALIGGFLLDLAKIELNLGTITVNYDDIVAALAGAFIFVVLIKVFKGRKKR